MGVMTADSISVAGKPSLVIDATLAPSPIQQSKRDKSYKQWLIQVVLEKVEERMGVELSRSECSHGKPALLGTIRLSSPIDLERLHRTKHQM